MNIVLLRLSGDLLHHRRSIYESSQMENQLSASDATSQDLFCVVCLLSRHLKPRYLHIVQVLLLPGDRSMGKHRNVLGGPEHDTL